MPLLLRLNVVLLHHEATHRILASTSATREKMAMVKINVL
jgi:hypothetical protein